MTSARRHLSAFAAFALTAMILPLSATSVAAESGATVPAGFRDEVVWSGFGQPPMAISFAPSGKAFVATKDGSIFEFDSLADTTPTLLVSLASEVHNYWDRGLMGMVVDPQFPTRPYVYALYAYDHQLGGPAGQKWGDTCPNPNPGGNTDGCVISGKLVRLTTNAAGTAVTNTTPLIEDWCQQYPSHSLGSLAFGPEGALYVTGGDGASFNGPDYGQLGGTVFPGGVPSVTPVNPCGDPLNEGGALRSQDIRTTADPTGLNGALLRIDPDTGAAWHDNANFGTGDANAQRIIAYGLRNPFRMTIRPGDGSVWLGDVGFNTTEEINTLPDPDTVRNFGWPCKEGSVTTTEYASVITNLPLTLCTTLGSAWTPPAFQYAHSANVASGDGCGTGSSAISGVAFRTTAGNYPSAYDNGLFFSDYTRKCIWFVPAASATAAPNFSQVQLFANLRRTGDTSGGSVFVGTTPAGDIIYADYDRKEVRAVHYDPALPPNATFTATPSTGNAPLEVDFDASGSTDPNGGQLTYAWDFDGDGQYDDDAGVSPTHTFTDVGDVTVGLKVTDSGGLFDTASKVIHAGNSAPVVQITATLPDDADTWAVGDKITFSGSATDAQDGGPMPATSFDWMLAIEHCPSDCHEHSVDQFDDPDDPATHFDGKAGGDVAAPDHDYPSYVRLYLTVTDSDGLSTTAHVDLQPSTGTVDAVSSPPGITLGVGDGTGAPPPAVTGIVGSHVTVSAPETAAIGEDTWTFSNWSDTGARNHPAEVRETPNHLVATYVKTAGDAPNTCGSASLGTTTAGWRPGKLGTGTDVDWYRFSLKTSTTMRIVLGNLPVDASLSLYNGCSSLITTSDRSGTGTEEIFRILPKGSYAVKVTAKGASSTDPYSLNIKSLPTGLRLVTSTSRVEGPNLVIVGEVYNGTSSTLGVITVTAKLYDAGGHLLATRTGRPEMYAAKATRVPFRMVGSVPAGYAKAVLSVTGSSTSKKISALGFSGITAGYDTSRYRMRGSIVASVAVTSIRTSMTSYDTFGTVVDVTRAAIGTSTLGAHKSTTFDAWSTLAAPIDRATIRSVGFVK